MMKKILYVAAVVLPLFMLGSCRGVYQYNTANALRLAPDEVRLNLDLDNFELLGETTISVQTRTYFGIFTKVDSINGESYNFRQVKHTDLNGWSQMKADKHLRKALYKVVEEFPNADYYVPVFEKTDKERLFLGRYERKQMTVKAYRFKQ